MQQYATMYKNVQKSYNLDLLREFRNVQNVQFVQNLLSNGISSRSEFEKQIYRNLLSGGFLLKIISEKNQRICQGAFEMHKMYKFVQTCYQGGFLREVISKISHDLLRGL